MANQACLQAEHETEKNINLFSHSDVKMRTNANEKKFKDKIQCRHIFLAKSLCFASNRFVCEHSFEWSNLAKSHRWQNLLNQTFSIIKRKIYTNFVQKDFDEFECRNAGESNILVEIYFVCMLLNETDLVFHSN